MLQLGEDMVRCCLPIDGTTRQPGTMSLEAADNRATQSRSGLDREGLGGDPVVDPRHDLGPG
jgi:hypothetical protein